TGGATVSNNYGEYGSGLYNDHATLTLTNTTVTGNYNNSINANTGGCGVLHRGGSPPGNSGAPTRQPPVPSPGRRRGEPGRRHGQPDRHDLERQLRPEWRCLLQWRSL